jgi:hypothetical protein
MSIKAMNARAATESFLNFGDTYLGTSAPPSKTGTVATFTPKAANPSAMPVGFMSCSAAPWSTKVSVPGNQACTSSWISNHREDWLLDAASVRLREVPLL